MSIDSTRAQPVATQHRFTVPWLTVLLFALVMAYADGFWMVALRGAVGSIQRSQEPFTTWLRESTLAVPVYLFAVLGALTLAMRWFGPALRTARPVVLTWPLEFRQLRNGPLRLWMLIWRRRPRGAGWPQRG